MAPRKFSVNYFANQEDGYQPGDAAAHRAAAALADRADMPTIAAFSEMLALLERVGGQFYLTGLRVEDESGDFDTVGLIFNYETRDAKIEFLAPPKEVDGIPITDISAEPTRIEACPPTEDPEPTAEEEIAEPVEDPISEADENHLPEPALSD